MKRVVVLAVSIVFGGCAVNTPKTPEEYKVAIQSSRFGKIEKVKTSRPFKDVVTTFQTTGVDCLSFGKSMTRSTTSYASSTTSATWTASVKPISKAKAQFVLQLSMGSNAQFQSGQSDTPEGGVYTMVADLVGVGSKETEVTIYGSPLGYGEIFDAMKKWTTGESTECPIH